MNATTEIIHQVKTQIEQVANLLNVIDLRTLRNDPARKEAITEARANLHEARDWLALTQ
jgi:hypothetical protein